MSLRSVIEEFYRAVWETSDTDAIERLLCENATIRGLEELDLMGQRDFVEFHRMIHAQMEEVKVTLLQVVEEGEWVACRLQLSARERDTGRGIDSTAHTMARIVGGRVVEGHNLLDFITIFQQLGRFPARALDHCLLGGRLDYTHKDIRCLN